MRHYNVSTIEVLLTLSSLSNTILVVLLKKHLILESPEGPERVPIPRGPYFEVSYLLDLLNLKYTEFKI